MFAWKTVENHNFFSCFCLLVHNSFTQPVGGSLYTFNTILRRLFLFCFFCLPRCSLENWNCVFVFIVFFSCFAWKTTTQSFIWPLARPATADESVIVELRTQTTKILLKTGLASTSTSRGTIASNSKIVGRYVMLMQGMCGFCFVSWKVLIRKYPLFVAFFPPLSKQVTGGGLEHITERSILLTWSTMEYT